MDNCCCVESCGSSLPGVARGNDFKVTARVSLYDEGTGKLSPLDLTSAEGVEMAVIGRFSRTEGADVRVDGSRVTASFPWSLPCGTYGVEILFRDAAGRGRVYDRAVFEVVDSVSDVTSAATDGDRQVSVDISVRTVYIGKGTDVSDYPSLTGKPKVNGVELIGNKTAEELGLATAEDIPDTSGLVKSEDLSKVATSGDYNDLTNKPSIPSAVTEETVSGWGFTKNSGNYSKPTGGIPKSDFASAVQTSLGKADTALQSETDPTVPDWAKQKTKPTYTAAEVGALPSTTKIPSKTSDLTNDGGYLTEGRLKTVNGQSLVGEGDVRIEGGGSSVTVDPELSDTSENPVQNRIVKEALDSKQDKGDYALKSDIPDVTGLATKSEVERVEGQAATNAASILRKVDKVDGKGLSANDYTDEDKAKVGKALTEHQSLSDYYTKEEVDSKVASGGTFDPTVYYRKAEVDALVGAKQDKGDYILDGKALPLFNIDASDEWAEWLTAVEEFAKGILWDDSKSKRTTLPSCKFILGYPVVGAIMTSYMEQPIFYGYSVNSKGYPYIYLSCGNWSRVNIRSYHVWCETETAADVDVEGIVTERPDWNIADEEKSSYIANKPTKLSQFDNDEGFAKSSDVSASLDGKVDKAEGKSLSSNDYTDEDKAKVASAITEHQDISGKQDVISDLETIRSGAAKGATALQSYTESDPVYTKDKPTLALKSEIPDVSGLAKKTDIPDTSGLVKSEDLSKVATSGDYNDLTNKPSIPSAVTEETVSGWGFTKNSGNYSKPTGGIPKSDLASAVQTSLGKADTALQSETDPTVPDWAKQPAKPTYTAAEVGALPSTTKIPSKTSDLSNDSGFLTEHQQLKTVNGNSLVGEGDITVEGGGIYDATSIYNKATSVESGSVEITQDEFEGLLEAVNAGKVIQIAYGSDGETNTDKSTRSTVIERDGTTCISIIFCYEVYVLQLNAAKTKAGKYLTALYDTTLLTDKDTDLSGAFYDLWNKNAGLVILSTPVGLYNLDISSTFTDNDWLDLYNAVTSRKIIKGVSYMSASDFSIQLIGVYDNISGDLERINVIITKSNSKYTIRRIGYQLADGCYELSKVTGESSTKIELSTRYDRICYYIDDMMNVSTMTVSLSNGFDSGGIALVNRPLEWLIQFIIPSDQTSIPSVSWPSSLKWANGEVLSLEADYTYEFHIVATRLGTTIVGQKFTTVILDSEM